MVIFKLVLYKHRNKFITSEKSPRLSFQTWKTFKTAELSLSIKEGKLIILSKANKNNNNK